MKIWCRCLCVCVLFASSLPVLAGTLEDKSRQLAELHGINEIAQKMLDQQKLRAHQGIAVVMDKMKAQFNFNEEFNGRLQLAADKYLEMILAGRTAEQIVDAEVDFTASHYTEAELDQLIVFASSDVGKKSARIGQEAVQYMSERFDGDSKRVLAEATQQFMDDLQGVARDCRCERKPLEIKKAKRR